MGLRLRRVDVLTAQEDGHGSSLIQICSIEQPRLIVSCSREMQISSVRRPDVNCVESSLPASFMRIKRR